MECQKGWRRPEGRRQPFWQRRPTAAASMFCFMTLLTCLKTLQYVYVYVCVGIYVSITYILCIRSMYRGNKYTFQLHYVGHKCIYVNSTLSSSNMQVKQVHIWIAYLDNCSVHLFDPAPPCLGAYKPCGTPVYGSTFSVGS